MLGGYCQACFEKQREIDRLQAAVVRLRARLRYQVRIPAIVNSQIGHREREHR